MKILFLGGGSSEELTNWLKHKGEDIIYKDNKITIDDVRFISPDFIVSYNYRYIIPKEIIDCVNGNAINMHISFLPYNRGANPNVWSFLEDTPKGVTIHYIDEYIDTGDIIVQREVFIDEEIETLKSSYGRLHREIQKLFKENWDNIKSGEVTPVAQPRKGTLHFTKEFLDLEQFIQEKGWDTRIKEFKKQYNMRVNNR